MQKKKVLVWETLATVSGGQKMTLTVMDMLSDKFEFCCLIPAEGMMSEELKKRNIPYVLMGDQTLPTGVKGNRIFSMRRDRQLFRGVQFVELWPVSLLSGICTISSWMVQRRSC